MDKMKWNAVLGVKYKPSLKFCTPVELYPGVVVLDCPNLPLLKFFFEHFRFLARQKGNSNHFGRLLIDRHMNELCTVVAVIKLSGVVAIDATRAALGNWAGSVTSILVGLSVFGSMNGSIICGARYLVKNHYSFSQALLWPLLDNVKQRSYEVQHDSYIRMSLSPFLIPLTSTTHIPCEWFSNWNMQCTW